MFLNVPQIKKGNSQLEKNTRSTMGPSGQLTVSYAEAVSGLLVRTLVLMNPGT